MFQSNSGRSGDSFPKEVQSAFHAYRESLPDFEGSPDFMPKLWDRIESQRKVTYSFRRIASGFVTVSAALCMTFAVVLWTPQPQATSSNSNTYVEVLADDTADEGAADSTAI